MARNQEAIRQWQILRTIAASRRGATIPSLAAETGVTVRTIRRDFVALQEAGFPLRQDNSDAGLVWTLDARALSGMESGFTLMELCALYFSRATLECLVGAPFHRELAQAFARFERAITPPMRAFLDRLPGVVGVKPHPGVKKTPPRERVSQLLDAALHHQKVEMRYHSLASQRVKDYAVDPHRVIYADGGLYLIAHVPEYGEVRTFAIERIQRLKVRDEHFEQPEHPSPVFANSLGVHSGKTERVEVEFDAQVGPRVAEREWHATQKVRIDRDGRVRIELHVALDWSLRRWILGFGAHVRVIWPSTLAEDILDELEAARALYAPRLDLEIAHVAWDLGSQRPLPFGELRRFGFAGEASA
ncbi:MAG TPA: transcriptional regulator [Vicinamibacterales bacterium]|jgi:predicted DNA-binding transcriptional regulator YafY